MKNFRLVNIKALLSTLKRGKNEVAVLIGSPLSTSFGTPERGVPSVKGMLELIENKLKTDLELYAVYQDEVLSKDLNDNDLYQASFEFLADYIDPDEPNLLIRQAVLEAYEGDIRKDVEDIDSLQQIQEDVDNWHIPVATEALAKLLVKSNRINGPVLTTNFDPLLSIALEREKQQVNKIILHGDSSLDQVQSNSINIVHMHGFWTQSDTMHSQIQLRFNRPKLKASLSRILKNKTLLVIGYGGWDDIFMHTLTEVMNDESANIDIIWALFESDEQIVGHRYEKMLNAVQPAIARNRFRLFGGIDCHSFLPELCENLSTDFKEVNSEQHLDETVEENVENNKSSTFASEDITLAPFIVNAEPAHNYIREVERAEVLDTFSQKEAINLVCDWGLGKEEFIESLVENTDSAVYGFPIYRIDLTSVNSKEELLEQVENSFGFGLQTFINYLSDRASLIFLDNYDSSLPRVDNRKLIEAVNWVIGLLAEFSPSSKTVLASKSNFEHTWPRINLSRLEEFDARAYITNHSKIAELPDEHVIESLIELSRGIPSFLDKYISELELLSIDDIYDSHLSPESLKTIKSDIYPSELVKRVDDLKNSKETHSERSFELLKALSILEKGDSFTNLKRAFSSFNLKPSHLQELNELELLETLTLTKNILNTKSNLGDEKLQSLPPVVRDYVYSFLNTEEIYEIVKRLADIHLGKNWRGGKLSLSSVTKLLIEESDNVTGSTYIIVIHLLRCSIELNNSRGIKAALRICEAFCSYLQSHNCFRELIKFIEQIKGIIRDSDKVKVSLKIAGIEGEALRMAGNIDKAEETLLAEYEKYENSDNRNSNDFKRVLSSLAFLYSRKSDFTQSNNFATKLLEIDSKNKDAKYIVASTSQHTSINELKDLEKYFRNNADTALANNTAIKLSDMESSNNRKLSWLDKVLSGKDDQYNKFRAVTKKGLILKENDNLSELSAAEINILHTSYVYCFSQKLTSIFNNSHAVLWELYCSNNDFNILLKLFQQSSLFWRIYGDSEMENFYSERMSQMLKNLLPSSFDCKRLAKCA